MRLTVIKQSLTSNLTLKVGSFILGYWFWFLLSGSQSVLITTKIPVYFYGSLKNKQIKAPDYISVDLQCKRTKSYTLNTKQLAAHINAETLSTGTSKLLIGREHIFLPQGITLLHCQPAFIPITVT